MTRKPHLGAAIAGDSGIPLVPNLRARIAELEAENERLKCCGNCGHIEIDIEDIGRNWVSCPVIRVECDGCFPGEEWVESSGWVEDSYPLTRLSDPCHFTPSRWTARAEEGSRDE